MDMKKGKDVAQAMSSLVNGFGNEELVAFIHEMSRDHRTLQQRFTNLCVMWFEELAKRNVNQYDLRNEASVKLAKKFVQRLDETDRALPFI